MNNASLTAAADATLRAEQVCDDEAPAVRALAGVMRKLHDLYPKKFNANVAARARVSTRAVDYWTTENKAERREMGARAFISLLLSDDGGAVLEAMMKALPARERPRWWLRHANTARLTEIEALQAAAEEEIKQLRLALSK